MLAARRMSTLERLFNEGSYWIGLRGTGYGCDVVGLGVVIIYVTFSFH
jgi:hypothetical protein